MNETFCAVGVFLGEEGAVLVVVPVGLEVVVGASGVVEKSHQGFFFSSDGGVGEEKSHQGFFSSACFICVSALGLGFVVGTSGVVEKFHQGFFSSGGLGIFWGGSFGGAVVCSSFEPKKKYAQPTKDK